MQTVHVFDVALHAETPSRARAGSFRCTLHGDRPPVTARRFEEAALRRRLVLDGAMATYLHASSGRPGVVTGCDTLSLSDPARVRRVHDAYLSAGADIVRTNTFRAASQRQAADAARLCTASADLARRATDVWTARTPDRPRFVAGALGPTDERGARERLRAAYRAPLTALLAAGVDLVLLETCCDPRDAAAALAAAADAAADAGRSAPVILSMTLGGDGRLAVSGATIDDLLAAIDPASVLGLGVNCGTGPGELDVPLAALRRHARLVTCHPSAGLPDEHGTYRLAPGEFARHLAGFATAGLADVVGGCCGTTPAHVAALAHAGPQ